MAKRACVRYGRGKGGRRVCRKYGSAVKKYDRKIRRGLRSGRYQTKCTGHTQRHPKRFRDYRCRDKATGKFVGSRFCKRTRCAR